MRQKKSYSSSTTTTTVMLLISQGSYLQLCSSQIPLRQFQGGSVNCRCFELSEFTTQLLLLSLNRLQHLSYLTETASQENVKRFVCLRGCFDSKRLMSLTSFVDVWQSLISLGLSPSPSSPENFADSLIRSLPWQNCFLASLYCRKHRKSGIVDL